MTRVKKAKRCRYRQNITNADLKLSKSETLTMCRVMDRTGGAGGPWFREYSAKMGLLE